ncbi:MAG TPA: adenylosuccinate synthetase, partial [Candidatus Paceibacterota bacterium]
IGITKAYTTRVGAGPMPTRISGEIASVIVTKGAEIGTTTGRVRDPGWLDLVLIREAIDANGINALAVTKLDVLTGFRTIKVATRYKNKKSGKVVDFVSLDSESIKNYQPVYKEFLGWKEDIRSIRNFQSFPKNAKTYIKTIENELKVPVKFISVGPKRGEVIWIN